MEYITLYNFATTQRNGLRKIYKINLILIIPHVIMVDLLDFGIRSYIFFKTASWTVCFLRIPGTTAI